MGKAMSLITKPLRTFNVESRAFKEISKEKPTPAPRHKSDEYDVEKLMKDFPEQFEESLKKHETLDKHLRDVFVKSHDPEIKQEATNPNRPLPLDRSAVEEFELGYKEPSRVPYGKITLKNALRFISHHQSDPKEYTAEKIAEEYNLSEEAVKNVLKYFRIHEVYIPDDKRLDNVQFFGPPVKRRIAYRENLKQLGPGKEEKS